MAIGNTQMEVISKSYESFPECAGEAVKDIRKEYERTRARNTPSVKVTVSCLFKNCLYYGVKVGDRQIDCIFDHAAPEGYYQYFRGSVYNNYTEILVRALTFFQEEMTVSLR